MKLTGVPRASEFPRLVRVKQQFSGPMLHDVAGSVRETLASLALPVQPGQTVALTVGSRPSDRGVCEIVGGSAVHHSSDGKPRRRHG
jgi:hypothetical protein